MARTTYQHGDLPAALNKAVLELVAEKGVRDLSLAEAARRTGVSTGAPYRHYANRDELLASVAATVYRRLVDVMREARLAADHPLDQLSAVVAAYVDFAGANRAGVELVFAAGLRKADYPDLAALNEEATAEFRSAAEQIVQDPAKVEQLVVGAAAVAHGVNMLVLDGSLSEQGFDQAAAKAEAALAARWMALGAREAD